MDAVGIEKKKWVERPEEDKECRILLHHKISGLVKMGSDVVDGDEIKRQGDPDGATRQNEKQAEMAIPE